MSLGAISALVPRVWLLAIASLVRDCINRANAISHIQSTLIGIVQHELQIQIKRDSLSMWAIGISRAQFEWTTQMHREVHNGRVSERSHLILPLSRLICCSDYWRRRKELLTLLLLLKNRLARQVVWCRKSDDDGRLSHRAHPDLIDSLDGFILCIGSHFASEIKSLQAVGTVRRHSCTSCLPFLIALNRCGKMCVFL